MVKKNQIMVLYYIWTLPSIFLKNMELSILVLCDGTYTTLKTPGLNLHNLLM